MALQSSETQGLKEAREAPGAPEKEGKAQVEPKARAPEGSLFRERREYRLTVEKAPKEQEGEAKLLMTFEYSAPPLKVGGEPEARGTVKPEGKERKNDAADTLSVTLSADGCVKQLGKGPEESREAGARAPAPEGAERAGSALKAVGFLAADTQAHLRFILGSGLHQVNLEPGKVYSLADLFDKGEGSDKSALRPAGLKEHAKPFDTGSTHLRFEKREGSGNGEILRFTILTSGGGGASSLAPDEKSPLSKRNEPQKPDERQPGLESSKWTEVGAATYQSKDGLLEKLVLDGELAPSLGRAGKTVAGQKVTIVRLQTIP
jgi:hypothetical protein